MDEKQTSKRIIRGRNLRSSESQHNLDQHIKSHDRDNDSPPPKKKKNMPLLKGTKSLLNHYSIAPKLPPSPIQKQVQVYSTVSTLKTFSFFDAL